MNEFSREPKPSKSLCLSALVVSLRKMGRAELMVGLFPGMTVVKALCGSAVLKPQGARWPALEQGHSGRAERTGLRFF